MRKKNDDKVSFMDIAHSTIKMHEEYLRYVGSEKRHQKQVEVI